jgi:stage II sporulation protein M
MEETMRRRYTRAYNSEHNFIKEHFRQYRILYILLLAIFSTGFIIGATNSAFLGQEAKGEASKYIVSFIDSVKTKDIDNNVLLREIFISDLKIIIYPWLLGLVIIGMPLIFVYIALEGYALGFTITSIIGGLGWGRGILFISMGVLPQEIILIPLMFMVAVNGIMFSRIILKSGNRTIDIKNEFYQYMVTLLISAIIVVGIVFFETYIGAGIVKFIVKVSS